MKKRGNKNLVIACSGGKHLGKNIAKKSGSEYSESILERFPDTEIKLRLGKNVKGKNVYLVQSFFENKKGDINDKLVEVLFAVHTCKELKARKVFLIAPYLAYLREDKRFEKDESVNARIMSELFKVFEKVYVLEPHLHRYKKFRDFFPNAKRISLSKEISRYVLKNIGKDCIVVGPDSESEQWAKPLAKELGVEYTILNKKRHSSRKVSVKGKRISGKKVIILDDIISTGKTLIEASRLVDSKKIYFIAIHGLFSENSLKELTRHGKVIASNSISSKKGKIDCSETLSGVIK
ncbi:MAG: ribose-phosphate diphosphokinase [Nanoarchaeota archaeon]